MSIRNNIKTARSAVGLTQKELASKCNLAEITIRQYETGKREPKYETLKRIAQALNVSMDYLITGKSSDELLKEIMRDVYKSSIGTVICEERRKQGLTQKELADYTGLTEISIKNCEESTDLPPVETIKIIASFLALDIGKIVGDLSLYPELEKDMYQNPSSYAIDYSNFLKACERIAKTQEKLFLEDYRKLNETGQSEARKRVSELTEIPRYTKPSEPFQD